MRKPILSLVALIAASAICCPLAVHAAGVMKQGLWEMTIKTGGPDRTSQIPPEKLEELRKRGVNIPQGGAMVSKVCVSKEMAERDTPPPMNRGGMDCKSTNLSRSGNTLTYETVCTGASMQGKGLTKVTIGSDTVTSVTDFTGTSQGRPINAHNESIGKYLGADCGSIQPMAMPK